MPLTAEQKKYWKPFLNVGSSLHKTVEEDDGTVSNTVVVSPKYHALNFNPTSWDWQVIGMHSNFLKILSIILVILMLAG